MKTALTIIAILSCTLWCSQTLATEPNPPIDPIKIPAPGFSKPDPDSQTIRVFPATRENCEGWVVLGFTHKQDIYKGELKVLDSNPPGKYDEQAINALLDLLSTQIPMRYSKLKTTVDDSGQKWNVYTYSIECNNWEVISQS